MSKFSFRLDGLNGGAKVADDLDLLESGCFVCMALVNRCIEAFIHKRSSFVSPSRILSMI